MSLLRKALEAVTTLLDRPYRTAELIAEFERVLSDALRPARIEICMSEEPDSLFGGVAIPLRIGGRTVGTILAWSEHGMSADIADVLALLAAPISASLMYSTFPERRNHARSVARTDTLSRIPNRLAFDERIEEAWARSIGNGTSLAVALVDIDFFKAFNDHYGHVAGDFCLRRVAAVLASGASDPSRFCARYGGEEFVLLFEGASVDDAVAEAKRVLDVLAARDIHHLGTTLGRVSVSVGIAATVPSGNRNPLDLVDEADRSLYRAKRFGRNRICAGSYVSNGVVVARRSVPKGAFPELVGPTFGRDDDLARTLSALRHTRMLSVVGPAGVGRTRFLGLLGKAATTSLDRNVVFVEAEILCASSDPAHALASAFDLTVDSGDPLGVVTDFLDDRDAILVLDLDRPPTPDVRRICEYIIANTTGVSIVAAAPAAFGIALERSIVLPPLDDEAAIDLLAFHANVERSACRSVVRRLGGNPAAIVLVADAILRLGFASVARRLASDDAAVPNPSALRAIISESLATETIVERSA